MTNYKNDYLRQKIENANGEICVLLDNIQHLGERPDLHQRLKDVTWKMNFLLGHFDIPEDPQ